MLDALTIQWTAKHLPPTVTTDGFADVVADGFVADEVPEEPETGALDVSPVR
jgi:hypothetical protein